MLIHDTHAHLDYLLKQNPELSIPKLLSNHEFWIQPGVNITRDNYCLENYLNYPNMYFMVGGHPGELNKEFNLEKYLQEQREIITTYEPYLYSKIVAIGEIGLDYRAGMEQSIKDAQQVFFDKEIKLAKELELPFVVHCREAWEDTLKIIENNLPLEKPFLIHCFTGDIENYKAVTKMGGYVAFGGIITYNKTEKLQEVVCAAQNYVIETDLPWLAPIPNRGKLNMPEYINDTINYIANKKNITPQEVVTNSKNNAIKIFSDVILNHIDKATLPI
jgi:TatD DNase family protein